MAYRSAAQVRNIRRVERLIRVAAPALDLVLAVGDRASRLVGRNQLGPERAGTGRENALQSSLTDGGVGLPPARRD